MGRKVDSVEPVSVTKRRVFVVGEGLTEVQYMEYFSQYYSEAGYFVCEILDKNRFDRKASNRNDLVDLAIGFITYRKDGKYTPFYLISLIFGDFFEFRSKNDSPLSDGDLKKLSRIRTKLIKSISTNKKDSIEVIDDVDGAVKRVVDELNNEWPDDGYVYDSPDRNHPVCPSPGGRDKVFIIMDRDSDFRTSSRSDDEYVKIIKRCKSLGFSVLLTTPLFEYWLLIHHDGASTSYGPTLAEKDEIIGELAEFEKEIYGNNPKIKEINADRYRRYYYKTFKHAVEVSKHDPLTTDVMKLIQFPGTNVGVELDSLLSNSGSIETSHKG